MACLDFSHGGNVYDAKRALGRDILDFSANINPLGLPRYAKKLVAENMDAVMHYPDPGSRDLVRAIARHWKIAGENILVGNGSIEFIYLIAHALKPETAQVAAPDFSEYERALRAVGARVSFLGLDEKDGFGLHARRAKRADILFFSNPNNPTGSIVVGDSSVVERLPAKTVVVDEAFMDFVPGEENRTMVRCAARSKKIVVFRTFTKFFALAGLRIGVLVAHTDTIRMLKRHQAPWSANALAQIIAERMLRDGKYAERTQAFVERERAHLRGALDAIDGLRPFPSVTNYILVKIGRKGVTSGLIARRLLEKGIAIRDCGNFRNLRGQFMRLAVRSKDENDRLIEGLTWALKR